MNETVEIGITDLVGTNLCIASEDGEKVYERIASALRAEKKIRLSFTGVEDLTSAFLNAAIGRLYSGEFTDAHIRESLKAIDATNEDLFLLKRVVDRAKEFFKDPQGYTTALNAAMDGENA